MAVEPSPELEKISRRLAVEQGLDEDSRCRLVRSYLDFLEEVATASDDVAPSVAVDEIWHRHILDTQASERDCRRWFGMFVHHRPNYSTSAAAPEPWTSADCSAPAPVPAPPCHGISSAVAR